MKSLNVNVYPKSGYMFQEKDGAKIFGDTWAGVIARVVSYRRRAKYDPGSPAEEVIAQACKREPVLCVDQDDTYQKQLQVTSLKSKILAWVNGIRSRRDAGEPPQFVNADLASQRAAICATCPKNTALPEGCASCRAVLTEIRKDILGRRQIDGRLSACVVLGEDLPVTVHLEQTALENGDLPPPCWRKKTL